MRKGITLLLILLIGLQGCASALLVGGIGAAVSAHDRRSTGNQLDDKTLYFKLDGVIAQQIPEDQATQHNFNVSIYNGVVLLTGQSNNRRIHSKVINAVKKQSNIKKVFDQVRHYPPIPASSHAHDVWLKSKIKGKLLIDKAVAGFHVGVTVEDSEVFLMGIVTKSEAEKAVNIVRNINGVTKVIRAFEYRQ